MVSQYMYIYNDQEESVKRSHQTIMRFQVVSSGDPGRLRQWYCNMGRLGAVKVRGESEMPIVA